MRRPVGAGSLKPRAAVQLRHAAPMGGKRGQGASLTSSYRADATQILQHLLPTPRPYQYFPEAAACAFFAVSFPRTRWGKYLLPKARPAKGFRPGGHYFFRRSAAAFRRHAIPGNF